MTSASHKQAQLGPEPGSPAPSPAFASGHQATSHMGLPAFLLLFPPLQNSAGIHCFLPYPQGHALTSLHKVNSPERAIPRVGAKVDSRLQLFRPSDQPRIGAEVRLQNISPEGCLLPPQPQRKGPPTSCSHHSEIKGKDPSNWYPF